MNGSVLKKKIKVIDDDDMEVDLMPAQNHDNTSKGVDLNDPVP